MQSSDDQIGISIQALKKQLKQMSKNDLIKLVIDQARAYQFERKKREEVTNASTTASASPS